MLPYYNVVCLDPMFKPLDFTLYRANLPVSLALMKRRHESPWLAWGHSGKRYLGAASGDIKSQLILVALYKSSLAEKCIVYASPLVYLLISLLSWLYRVTAHSHPGGAPHSCGVFSNTLCWFPLLVATSCLLL